MLVIRNSKHADVAKLADALDLGSSAERLGSSSLPVRTKNILLLRANSLLKTHRISADLIFD